MDCITLSMSLSTGRIPEHSRWIMESMMVNTSLQESGLMGKNRSMFIWTKWKTASYPLLMWSTHWSESGRRGKMLKHLPMRSWACIIGILKELMESLR